MASFSAPLLESSADVCDVVGPLLNCAIGHVDSIGGGRNSRVYKLSGENGAHFVAKFCTDVTRLTKEFSSLKFLVSQGIHDVPVPVAVSPKQHCAVYHFIEGAQVRAPDVGAQDIDLAVDFLRRLKALMHRPESRDLPDASEACFSIQDVVHNIQLRLRRLGAVRESGPEYTAFHSFLSNDFEPGIDAVSHWVQNQASDWQISLTDTLPATCRTLSPSDFGFHNVLRCSDGALAFLDFEHFGWDDPAKMISDFLLHPHDAMDFSAQFKHRFLQAVLSVFSSDDALKRRLELVFPLFGLKWCAIFLNEFVPKDLSRRSFAEDSVFDLAVVQRRQLIKAKRMLAFVLNTFSNFPYRVLR